MRPSLPTQRSPTPTNFGKKLIPEISQARTSPTFQTGMCVCVCAWGQPCNKGPTTVIKFRAQGGQGDFQSSVQCSFLQASQEAWIDHRCVPAPKHFELLVSVPFQCRASCSSRSSDMARWLSPKPPMPLLHYITSTQNTYPPPKGGEPVQLKYFKRHPRPPFDFPRFVHISYCGNNTLCSLEFPMFPISDTEIWGLVVLPPAVW